VGHAKIRAIEPALALIGQPLVEPAILRRVEDFGIGTEFVENLGPQRAIPLRQHAVKAGGELSPLRPMVNKTKGAIEPRRQPFRQTAARGKKDRAGDIVRFGIGKFAPNRLKPARYDAFIIIETSDDLRADMNQRSVQRMLRTGARFIERHQSFAIGLAQRLQQCRRAITRRIIDHQQACIHPAHIGGKERRHRIGQHVRPIMRAQNDINFKGRHGWLQPHGA
jgi:hypothetical protein